MNYRNSSFAFVLNYLFFPAIHVLFRGKCIEMFLNLEKAVLSNEYEIGSIISSFTACFASHTLAMRGNSY